MPQQSTPDSDEIQNADGVKRQDRNTKLRRDLQNVYAILLGEKTSESFAAFTFEEAVALQLERIAGESTQTRPNALNRVDRIANNAVKAVEQIQKLRPEEFVDPDTDDDVNTPQAPDDDDVLFE